MDLQLQAHFLNLYAIALSDKIFDEREVEVLYKIGTEKGVSREDIDNIIFNPANISATFPESVEEKIKYLYDYAVMIIADSIVHEEEVKILEKFCVQFGFEENNSKAIVEVLIEAAKNNVTLDEILNFVNPQV